MTGRSLGVAVAFVALIAVCAHARQLEAIPVQRPVMPTGTGTITGVVLDRSGLAASGATVSLQWHSYPSPLFSENYRLRTVVADAAGRFAFADVPQHAVDLLASVPGGPDVIYGQTHPGLPGTPIRLRAREQLKVVLRMSRGASLAGRVIHPDGAPARAYKVLAFRINGGDDPWLGDVSETVTDERGEYRLTGLTPGRYSLAADPPRPSQDRFAPMPVVEIAPGTFGYEARAFPADTTDLCFETPLALAPDQDRSDVDLFAHVEPVMTVNGMVHDSEGRVAAGASVWLTADSSCLGDHGPVQSGTDGTYAITRVGRGDYDVNAFWKSAESWWGRSRLSTDGRTAQPVPVAMTPQRGGSISGHIEFAGRSGTIAPAAGPFSLFLGAARDGAVYDVPGVERTVAAPEFSYPSVPAGTYVIKINSLPAGWFMQSELVDGRDALDFPFEIGSGQHREVVITSSNVTTELSGTVTDSRRAPSLDHTVVAFPADDRLWTTRSRRILVDRPDSQGDYHFSGLPAGEYIVALAGPEVEMRPPTSLLRALQSTGQHVTLRDGLRTTVNLRSRRQPP
ncbi:MAG TPA: carboxypeptidase-like regulatory domain-containing protein [Vicinamibacterales bacterium]|nr:carboxypeptidase-like regulatory domain-containing protein [Vicinamibacterales bacterium]